MLSTKYYQQLKLKPASTLVPFLYHTQTIISFPLASRRTLRDRDYLNLPSTTRCTHKNAFLEILGGNTSDQPALNSKRLLADSTLTGPERAVFDRINKFVEITRNTSFLQPVDHYNELDTELHSLPPDASLEGIFKDTIPTRENRAAELEKRHQRSKSQRRDLPQPPEPLKQRITKGTRKDQIEGSVDPTMAETIHKSSWQQDNGANGTQIQAAASRIDALLSNAKSDAEVWDILESEVFAKMRALTVRLDAEKQKLASEKKVQSGSKRSPRSKLSTTKGLSSSNSDFLLPFLEATYGSQILDAQRILRVRFPYSQYTLALLPMIKALGPISYVLGTSTDLYNEVLFIRWKHYRDLHACADLLAEMLNRGIPADGKTIAVYEDAKKVRVAEKSILRSSNISPKTEQQGKDEDQTPWIDKVAGKWWLLQRVQSGWSRLSDMREEISVRWKEESERRRRSVEPIDGQGNEEADFYDDKMASLQPKMTG